jgi:hypothetical protein
VFPRRQPHTTSASATVVKVKYWILCSEYWHSITHITFCSYCTVTTATASIPCPYTHATGSRPHRITHQQNGLRRKRGLKPEENFSRKPIPTYETTSSPPQPRSALAPLDPHKRTMPLARRAWVPVPRGSARDARAIQWSTTRKSGSVASVWLWWRRHSLQARPRVRSAVGPVGARRSRASTAFINASQRESARGVYGLVVDWWLGSYATRSGHNARAWGSRRGSGGCQHLAGPTASNGPDRPPLPPNVPSWPVPLSVLTLFRPATRFTW